MRLLDFLVTVLLPLIIQPTAACEDERQFVRHGGEEWTTLKRLAADHHNRLEEEAPRLLGIGTEPEFVRPARSALAIGRRKSALGLHYASRRPDRCRAQRARRYPRHRDLASALLHDDGGLGGAIRCPNIFAHCRSRVGDAQESAHPILGRNNAFVVGWSDTDQLRRTFRGRRGVALASRCKRQRRIAHRRYHSSRARSPLCELHAKLCEPDSARGRPRSNVILERIEPFSFEQIYGAWWKANVLSDAKAAVRCSTERERLGAGADLHQGFAREPSASTSWQDFPCA